MRSADIFYCSIPALQRTITTLYFFCKTRDDGTQHAVVQPPPLHPGIWMLSRLWLKTRSSEYF
jgi:hypothetical protein